MIWGGGGGGGGGGEEGGVQAANEGLGHKWMTAYLLTGGLL